MKTIENLRCPANIHVLLHCYSRCGPFEFPCYQTTLDAVKLFLESGLIEKSGIHESGYQTTLLGSAYVKLLCLLPPPRVVFFGQNGERIEASTL